MTTPGICKRAGLFFPLLPLVVFPIFASAQTANSRSINAREISNLRSKANAGESAAQFKLAELLESGLGVPQDYIEAAAWYRKAADAGNAAAQNNLGAMYALGHGVPADSKEAFHWYMRAASEGFAAAQNNVGYLYFALFPGPGNAKEHARSGPVDSQSCRPGIPISGKPPGLSLRARIRGPTGFEGIGPLVPRGRRPWCAGGHSQPGSRCRSFGIPKEELAKEIPVFFDRPRFTGAEAQILSALTPG